MVSPSARRTAAKYLKEKRNFSERRACSLVEISRTGYHYKPRKKPDEDKLRKQIKALSNCHKRYGSLRILALLQGKGITVNKKRVNRIWKEEGLSYMALIQRPRTEKSSRVPHRTPNHPIDPYSLLLLKLATLIPYQRWDRWIGKGPVPIPFFLARTTVITFICIASTHFSHR